MLPTLASRRRQSYGDSPLGLPAEVWLHVIHYLDPYNGDKPDTKSLSATNKFFRDTTLPALYNTLDLDAPDLSEVDTRAYMGPVIERVRVINSSPHILNAVRRLKLSNWTIRADDDRVNDEIVDSYITDDEEYDPVRFREDLRETTQLINDGYREIVTLLASLPKLHHLECTDCILAPEFFSSIFRISNLQSLNIDGYSMTDGTLIRFQAAAPSLHVFQFTPNYWYQPCLADVVKLFIPLISQFTVFSIPVDILAHVLVSTSLPIILPKLQKLSIFRHPIEARAQHGDLICIRDFLSRTPNLYELRITSDIHSDTRFTIPDTTIPDLKILITPSYIADVIVPGRRLEKLHIIVFSPRSFRKSYTSVSRDIKHLIYTGALNNAEEDLDHLAQVFPSVTTVEIMDMEDSTRSAEELSHAVLSILPKLRQLKQCLVSTVRGVYDHRLPSYCPLGRVNDPKYRSHPTLEELQILSHYRWTWSSQDGWHPVQSPDAMADHDGIHTQRFFK